MPPPWLVILWLATGLLGGGRGVHSFPPPPFPHASWAGDVQLHGPNQGPQVAMAMKDAAAMTCSHGSHENVGSVIMGLMRRRSVHARRTARRRPHGYRQTDPGCWQGCGTGAGSLDLLPPWSEAATAKSWRSARRAGGPRRRRL